MDLPDPNPNPPPTKKAAVSLVKVNPGVVLSTGAAAGYLTLLDRSFPSSPFDANIMASVAISVIATGAVLTAMKQFTEREFYALTPEEKSTLDAALALKANPAPETPDRPGGLLGFYSGSHDNNR